MCEEFDPSIDHSQVWLGLDSASAKPISISTLITLGRRDGNSSCYMGDSHWPAFIRCGFGSDFFWISSGYKFRMILNVKSKFFDIFKIINKFIDSNSPKNFCIRRIHSSVKKCCCIYWAFPIPRLLQVVLLLVGQDELKFFFFFICPSLLSMLFWIFFFFWKSVDAITVLS